VSDVVERFAEAFGAEVRPAIERGDGRPKRYRLEDGTVVPSVTTLLKARTNADGLIQWAMKHGHQAEVLRDEAGAVGSVAHDYMEALVCGEANPKAPLHTLPEHSHEEASNAITAARTFWSEWRERLRPVLVEVPLVSERHRFGGTPDLIAYDEQEGCHVVVDWKTSKRFYVDQIIQTGAYAIAVEEQRGIECTAGMVVRLPKDGRPPAVLHFEGAAMDAAKRQFVRLRKAAWVDAKLERFFGLGR